VWVAAWEPLGFSKIFNHEVNEGHTKELRILETLRASFVTFVFKEVGFEFGGRKDGNDRADEQATDYRWELFARRA
jgi:hypothetical protein